mgnify:CR=1 FL=1
MLSRQKVQVSLVALIFSIWLTSDSIIFDKNSVIEHYVVNQVYQELAAVYGEPNASFSLYKQTADLRWLEIAAENNHPEGAYLWSKQIQDHQSSQTWLNHAVNLSFPQAVLDQLSQKVEAKDWSKAQQLISLTEDQNVNFSLSQRSQIEQHKRLLKLADHNRHSAGNNVQHSINTTMFQPNYDATCRINILSLVENEDYKNNVNRYHQYLTSSKLSELPICFARLVFVPELLSLCNKNDSGFIDCDLSGLSELDVVQNQLGKFTHLLVITGQGEANTRGGLMYLDKDDTEPVFIHELAHWLGLIDEYKIAKQQQQQLCKTEYFKYIGNNLVITHASLSKQEAEEIAKTSLYPAKTCSGTDVLSYKLFPSPGFMQYLDMPLTDQYATFIAKTTKYDAIPPATMNFALDKKEKFEDKAYLQYLTLAAQSGYLPAINSLAEVNVESAKYTDAFGLLKYSAERGNSAAQIYLGHSYIEGVWLPRNLSKSAFWYKQAAEANDPFGLFFYGKCFDMGWGCIQSKEKARRLYLKSAQLGGVLARNKLGLSE